MRAEDLRLDERSGIPVYLQLRDQLLHAVARGVLRRGEQLPTVREVAVALSINPNTVNRAYAELEREGVLETQRGRGTFVADRSRRETRPHRVKLAELTERYVAQARSMGFRTDDLVLALDTYLRKHPEEKR